MQNTAFLDHLVASIAAHAAYAALTEAVTELRGKHLDPTAIRFLERKVSAALDRVEAADAAFPGAVDNALVDWQHATRLSSKTAVR